MQPLYKVGKPLPHLVGDTSMAWWKYICSDRLLGLELHSSNIKTKRQLMRDLSIWVQATFVSPNGMNLGDNTCKVCQEISRRADTASVFIIATGWCFGPVMLLRCLLT